MEFFQRGLAYGVRLDCLADIAVVGSKFQG
jgi:hypothetical protein